MNVLTYSMCNPSQYFIWKNPTVQFTKVYYLFFLLFLQSFNRISHIECPPWPLYVTRSTTKWINLFLLFFLWKVSDITLNIAVNVMADTGGAPGPLWFQLLNLPPVGLGGCKKHISMVMKATLQGMARQVMRWIQVLSDCVSFAYLKRRFFHFAYLFLLTF